MKSLNSRLFLLILFFVVFCQAKKIKISQKKYAFKNLQPLHPSESVLERGLVREDISRGQILDEYQRYSSNTQTKNFMNPTLGFITPWNTHGYEVAELFSHKFDMVSPCWFDIIKNNVGQVVIDGEKNIKTEWLQSMQSKCNTTIPSEENSSKCTKIIPRFVWNVQSATNMDVMEAASKITQIIFTYHFDGLVLEIFLSEQSLPLFNYIRMLLKQDPQYKDALIVVTINPSYLNYYSFLSDTASASVAYSKIDYFIIMTYDYSVKEGRFGPNSPIDISFSELLICIVDLNKFRNLFPKSYYSKIIFKLLLGMPFYGYDNNDAIVGHQVIDILTNQKVPFKFHKKAKEHSFKYTEYVGANNKIHVVYYPTLYSIKAHLDLSHAQNTGISIWEIGQGLDYFYDLL